MMGFGLPELEVIQDQKLGDGFEVEDVVKFFIIVVK